MDSKKFLDQEGVKFLWSKISMEDYPNNETLIAVLNAIDTTKQDKNLIVTKGADGLSTHSPAEILEAVNNGINVYYTPNISAGTLHPYLEGSNQVTYFHSNYIDNSRIIATGFLINANKNITVSNYSALDNYYNKTEVDELHNSLEEYIDSKANDITPPDWNQNNEIASDYIKNRTHWIEMATEVIVPEINTTGSSVNLVDYANGFGFINPNENYIITINGIQYNCVSWSEVGGVNYIGDSRLMSSGEYMAELHPEDVPFLIYYEVSGNAWTGEIEQIYFDIVFSTDETRTLKIERIIPDEITYHTLDENYIPDTIARKSELQDLVINIANKADKNYETWTFTLADGTIVEKQVLINA